jgi:hypothetical protein
VNCVTHHHACECREAKFAELEAENARLRTALELIATGGVDFGVLAKPSERMLAMVDLARAALGKESEK